MIQLTKNINIMKTEILKIKNYYNNVYDFDEVYEAEYKNTLHCAENLMFLSYNSMSLQKECQICKKIKTPLWRRTEEYHTLCNACGIREKVKNKKRAVSC